MHQKDSAYVEGYCAVVYHEADIACRKALREYRNHLREEALATLVDWPLGEFVERWAKQKMSPVHREWIDAFRLRYLTLEASQQAWDEYRRKSPASRQRL